MFARGSRRRRTRLQLWLVHEHRIDAGLAARVARLVVAARVDPQPMQSMGVLVYRLNVKGSVHCSSQVDQTKRKMNRLCGRLARPTLPCLVRLILMRRDPRHSIRFSHFSRPLSRPLYKGLLPVQRVRTATRDGGTDFTYVLQGHSTQRSCYTHLGTCGSETARNRTKRRPRCARATCMA